MGTLASLRRVATIERIGSSTRIEGSRLSDPEVEHLFELCRELKVSEEARLAAYRRLFEDALRAELLQRLRDCAIARLRERGLRARHREVRAADRRHAH